MDRKEMLGLVPKGGVCVEIGVHKGTFSREIFKRCEPFMLYLVDIWSEFDSSDRSTIYSPEGWEAIYQKLIAKYAPFSNVKLIRDFSLVVAESFPDESLDFIYIDANHDYEFVLADLKAWVPKVKSGGWITGHDYDLPGVTRAVKEFFGDAPVGVTDKEKHYKSYYFQKP